MKANQLSLHYFPDPFSRKDAWFCPHCFGKSDDRPWAYFLFSWHEMDCPYRDALKGYITFSVPCGNDIFLDMRA